MRVLVVDDDFRVARLHAEAVAQLPGFEVVGQVHTASAALESITRRGADLVLLDLYLPDASGLELLARIRALAEPPDVLVLSAAQDMASVRTAMRRGALHYLIKPFDLDALRDQLGRYARLHARRRVPQELDQGDVNELFGIMRSPVEPQGRLPKGRSPATAELVLRALAAADRPLSAGELAEHMGVSRATAQRYLTSLAEAGTVRLRLRYGTTGRPEHSYELDTVPRPQR